MRPLSILAIPIYQKLGKQYPNLTERREATKQYILNEVTQWKIKSVSTPEVYAFRPIEFQGTEDSKPFEVRLVYDNDTDFWELKFGNLNADNDKDRYKWEDKDPYRLQKALFLRNVLEFKIVPLLEKDAIKGILFHPYSGDGLEDDRFSYFYNMYKKLGKNKYNIEHETEGTYTITKKNE